MSLGDKLKKLEKKLRHLAEAPGDDVRHPLALRRRVLDAVEDRMEALGGARYFGGGRLGVTLYAADDAHAGILREAFVAGDALQQAVHDRLHEAGVAEPERLTVTAAVETAEAPDAPPFALTWEAPAEAPPAEPAELPAEAPTPAPAVPATVHLTIERGQAEQDAYTFTEAALIYVGRLAEVVNEAGHVTRRNDVAFLDGADPVNATVSREHAYLELDRAAGAYRLVDQDSACGTSVYRAGHAGLLPVRRRGVTLQAGDLLYFGKAAVRYEVG